MLQNYSHITFLLDSSTSMTKIAGETIESFNKFLKDQKEAPGKCTFTFAKFANEVSYPNENVYGTRFVDIQNIRDLDMEHFNPRGMTALNDAICEVIDQTGKELAVLHENDRPEHVLFIILTDGEDNMSHKYKSDVKTRITQQESMYNWKFIYLGANVDAQRESMQMGISNFTSYTADRASVTATYSKLSSDTLSLRNSH